jgi:hypothetical protein
MSSTVSRFALLVALLIAGCEPAEPEQAQGASPTPLQQAASPGPAASPTAETALGGAWLDQAANGQAEANWNRPGAAIPRAPKDTQPHGAQQPAPVDLRPQTPDEKAVTAAGWTLDQPSVRKGSLVVVQARTGDADTMGRPHHVQAFVFSNGRYAGTLSPVATMAPRTDGMIEVIEADDAQRLRAVYTRYEADDGLCCPSRESRASFVVKRVDGAPVVVLEHVETIATSSGK